MKQLFFILFTAATLLANAQAGTQKQIGPDGAWGSVTAAASLNNKLYTTEKNGSLVQTDLNTGMRKVIGKAGFDNNRFLFTAGTNLFMIDFTGTLYKVNIALGTKEKLGIGSAYAGIYAIAAIDDILYGIDTKGNMIMGDLTSGDKSEAGGSNYMNVASLYVVNNKVYCVEQSGSLFEWAINGGTKHMIGKMNEYAATIAGTAYEGELYLVNKSGILSSTNVISSGDRIKIGKPIFGLTKFIFAANGKLYTIESMGSLYEAVVK